MENVGDTLTRDLQYFRLMTRIRQFETMVDRLFMEGKVFGTMHLSIGQEAVAVGVCTALQPGDVITSTHRGHGHNIALGGDLSAMIAELLGKATGSGQGYGGSMHIADRDAGNLGANGIVGAGLGIGVGAALAFQLRKASHVVVSFAGDGALHEGIFHEAASLASIWNLPWVLVVENNQYAMSASVGQMFRVQHLSDRAVAYGFPGVTVDGNDVHAVAEATKAALERARSGAGPTLLEAVTYRYRGHSKNDPGRYRPPGELEAWKAKDPILRLRRTLLEAGVDVATLDGIEHENEAMLNEALAFAESSPWPEPEELIGRVYAPSTINSNGNLGKEDMA